MPSFELIIAQVLYWLLDFVSHHFNFVCSGSQAEKVHELNEEIGKLLAKAEQLGAEGNVDEAQKVLQEVEKVRTRKKDAEVSEGWSKERQNFNGCCCFAIQNQYQMCFVFFCLAVLFLRKNTETPCLRPVSSSRSCECARCVPPTWACMTTTADWLTTSGGSSTWASFKSERNWTN